MISNEEILREYEAIVGAEPGHRILNINETPVLIFGDAPKDEQVIKHIRTMIAEPRL